MTDLGTLGGTNSYAQGINTSGQVVGDSYTPSGLIVHAFLYSAGAMTDLGTLGGTSSDALGINASGQVVGFSATPEPGPARVPVQRGAMTDLGTLGGTESYCPCLWHQRIRPGSRVCSNHERAQHAFLYSPGP